MQFFSSDQHLQEIFFQNHPPPPPLPQELNGLPLIDLVTTDKLSFTCTKKPITHLDTLKPRNISPKDVKQHFFRQLCHDVISESLLQYNTTLWHVQLAVSYTHLTLPTNREV